MWLDNKQGIDICTRLIFSGIHVDGFCSDRQKELTSFLGKPVVEIGLLAKQPDVLIVYWNEDEGMILKEIIPQMQALCLLYRRVFELRKEIYQKENVIYYSSRQRAERVTELLAEHHVEVCSYASIGEGKNNDKLREKSVDIDRILETPEKYNLILASSTYFFEKDIQGLPNVNIDIYVPGKDVLYTSAPVIFEGNLGFFLDKPIREGKKMKLYGTHSCFTNAWLYFFHDLNIKAEKMVDNVVVDDGETQSVYDLPYENTADTYVIINKELGEWVKSCELVESLGFTHINENYAGLYQVGQRNLLEKKDVTLGYVTETLVDCGVYPGFQVYGGERENDLRIVTLGGSTTAAELFRVKCWPEILYRQFLEAGRNVTIYNGGVAAYTAGEELFKLIRDVGELRPDIVISFSGLNNFKKNEYPFVPWYLKDIFEAVFKGDFCKGIKNGHMSAAQIWVRQEQMMKAICSDVYNAEFICFVQPMYVSKEQLSLNERLMFEVDRAYRENALEFREEASQMARQFDWMIDIQSLLDDKPEVFMDSAHVYEAGNRIIADIIYRQIGIQADLKGKAAKYSNLERK